MREKILIKLADLHSRRPWSMLALVTVLTIIFLYCAAQLSVTMQMRDLLPAGDPKVDQFNEIIDEFATATSLIVVVQGQEEKIKSYADDLAPRVIKLKDTTHNKINRTKIEQLEKEILSMHDDEKAKKAELRVEIEALKKRIDFKLFQRVDYKTDTDFLRNHALMLIKAEDLKNTKDTFSNPNLVTFLTNINNSLEQEYAGRQESISTREKEDGAVAFLDGIESLINQLQIAVNHQEAKKDQVKNAADKFLFGEPYFLSYDKSTLLLNIIPNFTIMDRDLLTVAADETQILIDELIKNHPGVRAGLSGDIARENDEQAYAQKSISYTSIIAFVAILILLMISFKMWVAPLLAIITLFVGIVWANGMAFLAVGELTIMTAMLSIVLLGLGIDFAIHIVSGITEWRAAGVTIEEALKKTFLKSGKAIITGAITTACAFLALMISQSRGMKEMGIVTGLGLIAIMLATFLFLPVMMVFRERYIERRRKKKKFIQRDITLQPLGRFADWLGKHYIITVIASFLISIIFIWSAMQIGYEQNYMKLEPKGLTSIALADTINEKFDLSMEYGLCLTENIEESREMAEKFRELGTVAMTSDISAYMPSQEQQKERIPFIKEIYESMKTAKVKKQISGDELSRLKNEIERLEMNIMEMQDMAFLGGQDKVDNKCKNLVGDPEDPNPVNIFINLLNSIEADKKATLVGLSEFQEYFAPYYKKSVMAMCTTDAIKLSDLPVTILDQFSNTDRDKFMITIYPSGQLYTDARVLNGFVEDVERVNSKATGTPLVSVAWLKIAARDGRNAILLTLLIVFFLLWTDFKKPYYALIAMIPLALGVFWMVGIMQLSGMLLNFMTMMGLPLIIGIGIDDGVHIMHRWKNEGEGRLMTVYSSTGKAVLITSLTTMLAFGSMTFSVFPAWAFFGESLFIGVGACFLTTVIILPGIIGWLERKEQKK